jgi:4-amino-4-deoxy-L-arabinose transferase-like glycosyltransferase
MSASHPTPAVAPATSPARRVPPLVWVLAASLALSLFIALELPLLDPDEGRNAEVAREMAVGGDLVIPHLAGMPYLDKPPGFFWAAALSIRAFGHTPLAARLPSIVASLALLAIVGRAATRAGGVRFGWLAPALLAGAPLFAGLSAYVIFDMMLALCVTVVWLGVTREVEIAATGAPDADGRALMWRRLAMFAAIAAGILTKGPVMLAWAIGGSLGAALLTRSRAALAWLVWWPGWVVALGLPGAWFAAATSRFPEYPHYAFVEESFERMATGSFHRQQPWWFVPAVLVGGTLPWSLMTRWSRERLETSARGVHVGANTGVGFMLFTLAFFTLSHSKLVTYVLPALPPMAWSAAAMWDTGVIGRLRGIALAITLLFTPALALSASRGFREVLWMNSGVSLTRLVEAAGAPPTIYVRCYSPGTDYLLGRTSPLVSERGEELTSNYVIRYRNALENRHQWSPLDRLPPDFEGLLIRSIRDSVDRPPGKGTPDFSRRFVFFRHTRAQDSAGH